MTWVMLVVTVLSTALRFWSRTVVMGGKYGLDDWIALAALPPTLLLLICDLCAFMYGVGGHDVVLPPHHVHRLLMLFWIGTYGFNISIGLAKLSMLAFYARVFGPWKLTSLFWKVTFLGTVLFTLAWTLAETFYNTFRCHPVIKVAIPNLPGYCASLDESLLTSAILNVANDVMILLLPMPPLFKLQMQWRRRLLVGATLFLGYSVAMLSVGRLVVILRLNVKSDLNPIYPYIPVLYWLVAEPTMSLLGISLPTIYQLIQRGWQFGLGSLLNSHDISQLRLHNAYSRQSNPNSDNSDSPMARHMSENHSIETPTSCAGRWARAESFPPGHLMKNASETWWRERTSEPP